MPDVMLDSKDRMIEDVISTLKGLRIYWRRKLKILQVK